VRYTDKERKKAKRELIKLEWSKERKRPNSLFRENRLAEKGIRSEKKDLHAVDNQKGRDSQKKEKGKGRELLTKKEHVKKRVVAEKGCGRVTVQGERTGGGWGKRTEKELTKKIRDEARGREKLNGTSHVLG